jgi:uncharacterized pyridoxamine 5'-phosphate oxidase family protein
VDKVPQEIQEIVIKLWITSEDRKDVIDSVTSKTDLRWLDNIQNTAYATKKNGHRLFQTIIEFEKKLCKCGAIQGFKQQHYYPIRHNKHISFCNIVYMNIDMDTLQNIPPVEVQLAFRLMKKLTDFEVKCMDTDLQVVHAVSGWLSEVQGLSIVRFNSKEVIVSGQKLRCDSGTKPT